VAQSDEKEAMASKLALLATVASLAGFAAAPSAGAVGLHGQRVVATPDPPASNSLIAPPTACPNQSDLAAPAEAQERAMRCMTNFARHRAGLVELSDAQELDLSASDKSGDILRCDNFSHFACGREFTYWMRQAGYISTQCWRVGENLAWGTGGYGTVRAIFRAWMRSPGHRQNILGDYSQTGISLLTGNLAGRAATHVWTEHFGSHCDGQPAQA
jgi:uncharacterized protein YkwD